MLQLVCTPMPIIHFTGRLCTKITSAANVITQDFFVGCFRQTQQCCSFDKPRGISSLILERTISNVLGTRYRLWWRIFCGFNAMLVTNGLTPRKRKGQKIWRSTKTRNISAASAGLLQRGESRMERVFVAKLVSQSKHRFVAKLRSKAPFRC